MAEMIQVSREVIEARRNALVAAGANPSRIAHPDHAAIIPPGQPRTHEDFLAFHLTSILSLPDSAWDEHVSSWTDAQRRDILGF